MGERKVYVFSNLSLPEEKFFAGRAVELAALKEDFYNAVVVLID
jgi:precorrin-6B methylase 1